MARRRSLREARRFRLTETDAQDVAQETILRAWRNLSQLDNPSAFEPWVAAIARREALRAVAQRNPGSGGSELDEQAAGDDTIHTAELRVDLVAALRTLPAVDRALAWLRFGEDLSHKEVANRLGMSETAVRVRTYRLRTRLLSSPAHSSPDAHH